MAVQVTKNSSQDVLYVLDLHMCIHGYNPCGGLVPTDLKVALSQAKLLELML